MTVPVAGPERTARSSMISACNRMLSSSASTPSPVLADTFANIVSPPQSSGITSSFASSCLMRSGSAPGLSILLMATMIGTPPALAWRTASSVCGMTPSSAATTIMTISVTLAPRARIAVKASWPGVSRNVIMPLSVFTLYAPMCCVMPPASESTTFARRM